MAVTINGSGTISGVSAGGYSLTDADLPNGSVVQVVYAGDQPSSTLTTTSTSYVDTGISATITPSSSSNKVFIMADLHVYLHGIGGAGWTRANFLIKRDTCIYV